MDKKPLNSQDPEVRKGPWTMEEDLILINYIANHGEGVWNSLAKSAGLKRTGKSCRLRWLNYLRPDVRRGNITPEEQLLIMELHAKWGNRWSKIAKHLPGRTDNEIKNYWRTRIQKHLKQAENFTNGQASTDSPDDHHHHHTHLGPNNHEHFGATSMSTSTSQVMDHYHSTTHEASQSSPSQCTNTYNAYNHQGTHLHQQHYHHVMEGANFQGPNGNLPPDSNENYWSMEDLWSMQLLTGD